MESYIIISCIIFGITIVNLYLFYATRCSIQEKKDPKKYVKIYWSNRRQAFYFKRRVNGFWWKKCSYTSCLDGSDTEKMIHYYDTKEEIEKEIEKE